MVLYVILFFVAICIGMAIVVKYITSLIKCRIYNVDKIVDYKH